MKTTWWFYINPNLGESNEPSIWAFSEIPQIKEWCLLSTQPHAKSDSYEKLVSIHPLNSNLSANDFLEGVAKRKANGYKFVHSMYLPLPAGDDYYLMTEIVATFLQRGAEMMNDQESFVPENLLSDIVHVLCKASPYYMNKYSKRYADIDKYMAVLNHVKTELFDELLDFGKQFYNFSGYLVLKSAEELNPDEIIKSFVFKRDIVSPIW